MQDYDKKALSKLRLENAVRCMESAKLLLAGGDYKSAANRSYYAVFYAIRALLALEGIDYKKHSAVLSHFRKEYLKTNILSPDYSSIVSELFEVRTDSDYDDFFIISKQETETQVSNAERLLKAIREYLVEAERRSGN